METSNEAIQAQISKQELLELIELKNHLLQIGRVYLRKREELGFRMVAGAQIDPALSIEELLELILVD
jgi:hypothetical protein